MARLLRINDAAWLWADRAHTPMQIGVLATLEQPEDAGPDYVAALVAGWRQVRRFAPPFNFRPRGPLPRWGTVPDEDIDLDHHLHHHPVLPSPGGAAALNELVGRLHARQLDRRRPLWEVHVVEGVGPRTWALYFKLHHSQFDGVGGLRMAGRYLSVDPHRRGLLPLWAVGASAVDQSGAPRRPRAAPSGGPSAGGAGRTLAQGLGSVGGSLLRTYAETLGARREPLRAAPYDAPKAPFNGRIGPDRRFATHTWEVQRLRAVATAAGCTVNDVFLAVTGGGLRGYLAEAGRLPERGLVANVPVSVRAEGADRIGTVLTFLWTELGTDVVHPVDRLAKVRASTLLAKERVPVAAPAVVDAYTVLLMLPVLAQAVTGTGGVGRPAFNVVVSNVPGLAERRWLEGSLLTGLWPLSLVVHGQGLNITAVTSGASFSVGYTGAADAVPHLDRVAAHSDTALQELEAAYRTAEPGRPVTVSVP